MSGTGERPCEGCAHVTATEDCHSRHAVHRTNSLSRASGCAVPQQAVCDCAVVAFPENVGTDDFLLLTAGKQDAWLAAEVVLGALGGRARQVASAPEGATILDVGLVGAFHMSTVAAFVESARYAAAQSVPLTEALEVSGHIVHLFEGVASAIVRMYETDDFATDQASLPTYDEAARTFRQAFAGAGSAAPIFDAVVEVLNGAVRTAGAPTPSRP